MGNSNKQWIQRAKNVTPGNHSNMAPYAFADGPVIAKGRGAHVWDVEDKEYIDFTIGSGPGILGYGDGDYIEAVKKQLEQLPYLTVSSFRSTVEIELAESIVELVPCAEKVRFCLSGTEAVQLAIRLARAYTQKPYIVQFEGHYHGWMDNIFGRLLTSHNHRPSLQHEDALISGKGIEHNAFASSFLLPWNDVSALEAFLEKHGHDAALILMEPINCNGGCCMPMEGYLEQVRELATHYKVLLCFDEIITGFRVDLHSAQGLLGVVPDLTTFGKALGGGIPLAAVAGRSKIMDLLIDGGVPGPGTFNGNPLAAAASLATLRILKEGNGIFYLTIQRLQERLMEGLKSICDRYGIPALIQGPTGVFSLRFTDSKTVHNVKAFDNMDQNKFERLHYLLRQEGILIYHDGRWYVCGGHTEKDIDRTLECADRVMADL